MSEKKLYETRGLWASEKYLGNKAQRERLEETAKAIPNEATSLLDVGCGNGAFLSLCENKRNDWAELLGCDRSEQAIASKVCNTQVVEGSIDELPFEDQRFDCVSALEVIEHLPVAIFEKGLSELGRVSKNYVVITVPFREKRRQIRCPYCDCSFNPYYHMRSFDEAVMRALITDFNCVSLRTIGSAQHSIFDPLRRFYNDRLRRESRGFPHARCPLCGYQKTTTPDKEFSRKSNSAQKKKLFSFHRPRWFIGVYQRMT